MWDIAHQSGIVTDLATTFRQICNHPDSYIGSLGYYMLTGRKGAQLYQEGNSYLVVCQHPHIEDKLIVFPEINGDGSLTAKVLHRLDVPRGGVQLARYTDADLLKLHMAIERLPFPQATLFREMDETVLDWKYPAYVIDTRKTGDMQGKEFDKLRNKFNKVAGELESIPLHSDQGYRAMRSSLMFWIGAMIYCGKETGHDLGSFYQTLFKAIKEYPEMFDGVVFLHKAEPAGFTIWDRPVQGTVNALAGLSRMSVKGMSEFQTVTACRVLAEQGIHSYNLGGSETAGLDQYKLKYAPSRSLHLKSYDVVFDDRGLSDLKVWSLPKLENVPV